MAHGDADDELDAVQQRFAIEQYAARGVQLKAFPATHSHRVSMSVDLNPLLGR
jgi:hypothetical protein